MITLVDYFGYLIKNFKIDRLSYSHVSRDYCAYSDGFFVGHFHGKDLDEAKPYFKTDIVEYVDLRDCFEAELDMDIYHKAVEDFIKFGIKNPILRIFTIDKNERSINDTTTP